MVKELRQLQNLVLDISSETASKVKVDPPTIPQILDFISNMKKGMRVGYEVGKYSKQIQAAQAGTPASASSGSKGQKSGDQERGFPPSILKITLPTPALDLAMSNKGPLDLSKSSRVPKTLAHLGVVETQETRTRSNSRGNPNKRAKESNLIEIAKSLIEALDVGRSRASSRNRNKKNVPSNFSPVKGRERSEYFCFNAFYYRNYKLAGRE